MNFCCIFTEAIPIRLELTRYVPIRIYCYIQHYQGIASEEEHCVSLFSIAIDRCQILI
jgi:hypothetical protein